MASWWVPGYKLADKQGPRGPLPPFVEMQLTRGGDYAVRVMAHLASVPWGTIVPRRQIQAGEGVPSAHLAKIIQALGRARLLLTFRGAGGGVRLALRPEEITLRQVIEAVEGPVRLNRCLVRPGACPRDTFCTAHPVWHRIQAVLMRELDGVTLAALAPGGGPAHGGGWSSPLAAPAANGEERAP